MPAARLALALATRPWWSARRALCGLWLALLLALLAPREAAANSRDLKWRTLQTEHFYIHYHQGEEDAADRAARLLERAHARLSVGLGHSPWLRTQVVLTDNTDEANGVANAVPFPRLTANLTAPNSMSVLESYDDWLDILLVHEYTHVVHLDTVHGIPRLVNAVLGFGVAGKVWSPNLIQPRWMVEGLASYEESHLGSQGRMRSAQFDMMLRMAVLEHQFLPIDRVSSGANIFPHGAANYLYGLHFVHYIATRYGEDKLRELSHVFGGQAIPFAINRAIEKVLGVDFHQLWHEFELDTTRRFEGQARTIRARGIREGKRLTYSTSSAASGQFNRHPFWGPDDEHIYFYQDDGHSNPGIRRLRSTGGRIREGVGVGRQGMNVDLERVVEVQDAASGSFVLHTGDLVYEVTTQHDFRYSWSDLVLRHGDARDKVEPLTRGSRARDPHVSPDGRTVVFSRNDAAQSRLAFLDLHTRKQVEVDPGDDRIGQVFSPRWAPDSRRVAFSGWREGGYRDIYVYDRGTGKTERITADRFLDTEPCWTPDGAYILFASDRDHVFNLYAYEVEAGVVHQVTNVLGGAFEPVVSNDGTRVAYIGFSAQGYDVWVMKLDPAEFFAPLPVTDDLPTVDDPTPAIKGDERPLSPRSRRYQPIRTLYPRTLLPTATELGTSVFGTEIAATLQVTDVLSFHTLSVRGGYTTAFDAPVGSVAYRYAQLLPTFTLGVGRSYAIRSGFQRYNFDSADDETPQGYRLSGYRERITRFSGQMDLPVIRHPIHTANASVAYSYSHFANLDADGAVDPNAPASTQPAVGGLGQVDLALSYSNIRSVKFGYASETGRALSVRMSVLDPHLGGRFGDLQVTGSYAEMLRMPWRGHQVLAFRVVGGASAGGLTARRGAFFVGGYGQQEDVIRTLLVRDPISEGGALRGFLPGIYGGRYYTVANLEYRIPVADVERGLGLLPLFMRRITMIPFADLGGAWTGSFTRQALKWGVGASLVLSFKVGYLDSIDLFLQYAHGFDPKYGLDTFRAMVAKSF